MLMDEPPGQLYQTAAHPGIARLGQTLFALRVAAGIRRAGEAGVTGHRTPVAEVPG